MAEREYERDEAGRFSGVGGGVARKHYEALTKLGRAKKEAAPPDPTKHEIYEAKAEDFHKAFTEAFKDSDMAGFVTHYPLDQLKKMKLFTTKDGKAGVAVHDHGDGRVEATALFNNGAAKGAGLALLRHTVANEKVNYVECFGPALNKLYGTLGFKVSTQNSFNPTFAPPNWNTEKHDSPDYFTMKL